VTPAAERVRPRRRITGMSAVLLPFTSDGHVDWDGFASLLARTRAAGLVPAVNMDTGFGGVLDDRTRRRVIAIAAEGGGEFVAGAYVDDRSGDALDVRAYSAAMDDIAGAGGTPIVFPSFGLMAVPEEEVGAAFAALARGCDRFLAFELGEMFAPAGRIFTLDTYRKLLEVPECVGAKHSSLDRQVEWDRLAIRDAMRPDFMVLTGNDLAIDMVMYGSDYLLGLSTFAPDAFAQRDHYWEQGDDRFYALNDVLQYLGAFSFREPVPGYRHDAAMFLRMRGWIGSDRTHSASPTRPQSDRAVLEGILSRLEQLLKEI
jgi:dihydrodipicolinate synthase/N-acetylneuraminate lyase